MWAAPRGLNTDAQHGSTGAVGRTQSGQDPTHNPVQRQWVTALAPGCVALVKDGATFESVFERVCLTEALVLLVGDRVNVAR